MRPLGEPSFAPSALGGAGDHAAWREAIASYDRDDLAAAYAQVRVLGVGLAGKYESWFRLIEAEAISQSRSVRESLGAFLEWERIPEETEGWEDRGDWISETAQEIARRFRYEPNLPVRVSVLAAETDAPWTVGRYGYCIQKSFGAKICLPRSSLATREKLRDVMAHEYAHVVTLALAEGSCPRWLDEAVAMVSANEADLRAAEAFASGAWSWWDRSGLQAAFRSEKDGLADESVIWRAYQQSAWIGEYLVARYGDESLGTLLRAFSNNTVFTELKLRLTGADPADEALHEVYSLTVGSLLDRSHAWLCSGRPPCQNVML